MELNAVTAVIFAPLVGAKRIRKILVTINSSELFTYSSATSCQPYTQALSTTLLAGRMTLVQADHVSPREVLGDNNWDLWGEGGREGKCGVRAAKRVQNNARSVNKQHKGLP
jgi:hypothetical protein